MKIRYQVESWTVNARLHGWHNCDTCTQGCSRTRLPGHLGQVNRRSRAGDLATTPVYAYFGGGAGADVRRYKQQTVPHACLRVETGAWMLLLLPIMTVTC
ncbi:hypothetical protein GN958_ATG08028 [Phytophthora infestans]|uniref:Uncharacterized protein n=1 Tax=Phytophthora infestans TaxID=4787 RepID=A0A8S9UPZ1_PHYIN|nr:hypothetical protein GN958_ATG08028 [Phytophthora infestans]